MEAESESSESDHATAATEDNLADDFEMHDIDDNSHFPTAATENNLADDFEMDDNSHLDPNPRVTPEPSPPTQPDNGQLTIEDEVSDEEEYRWIENYPKAAGSTHGQDLSKFESLKKEQTNEGSAPWFPFESEDEWELGRWLMTSGISQKKIDSFLKLHKVRTSPH
jgi:hypothetical protein